MKKIVIALCMMVFLPICLVGQSKDVYNLPSISLIGNMIGVQSNESKSFGVNEIELAFQHYIYPTVKADIFLALHKEEDGGREFELEEGYVTFLDPVSLLFPNLSWKSASGVIVGKKLLSIGKLNPLHPEQWQFVDRPIVLKQFFGHGHGLSGEGVSLSHLLPTPFFSQLEIGYWQAGAHEEEADEEHHEIEYENSIVSARLWNSFAVSKTKELEIGLNMLRGNADSSSQSDQQELFGIDATYNAVNNMNRGLHVQAEYFTARYGEEGEERNNQDGYYISSVYKFNAFYNLGIRYSHLGKHEDEGETLSQWSIVGTKQLTETSKFRLQYSYDEHNKDVVLAQFIFGMGPHSHVLQ